MDVFVDPVTGVDTILDELHTDEDTISLLIKLVLLR